jgi:hypothetical protein
LHFRYPFVDSVPPKSNVGNIAQIEIKIKMHSKLAIAIALTLTLLGCNDYPGHRPSDPTKLLPAPDWGSGNKTIIGGECNIDSINDQPGSGATGHELDHDQILVVKGWASVAANSSSAPSIIAISLKEKSGAGNRHFAMPKLIDRPDVADFFKNPGAISSGFYVAIDISTLSNGNYDLEVFQNNHGVNTICPYTASISII